VADIAAFFANDMADVGRAGITMPAGLSTIELYHLFPDRAGESAIRRYGCCPSELAIGVQLTLSLFRVRGV
jgi:hypothetical protein